MKLKNMRIGIIHSIIGKNDGVSIVIDQSVKAMLEHMDIPLGNIYFLCALSPSRFHVTTDEVFWHKNEINKMVVKHYSGTAPEQLDSMIAGNALYAKEKIAEFVKKNRIDLIIAHNTTHPYNFITAVGLGLYIEEQKKKAPRVICWWHDSHWERPKFRKANSIVAKYLKYLPGTYLNGIIFINSQQPAIAYGYLENYGAKKIDRFFRRNTCIIPNTFETEWKWEKENWKSGNLIYPPQDSYNRNFFKDCGVISELRKMNMSIDDAVILLQHTRVVPRKKIETAIDLSFRIGRKYSENGVSKAIILLVSGHSGDEQEEYKKSLKKYFEEKLENNPDIKTALIFGESVILPEREIIVDKKYYRFSDVPSIVASAGGIGTYFSEIEGFGNNLLEMLGAGLPVILNRYDIYKSDIEPLGFKLPYIDGELNEKAVERTYQLLTDIPARNSLARHNLKILEKNLGHHVIAEKLARIIRNSYE